MEKDKLVLNTIPAWATLLYWTYPLLLTKLHVIRRWFQRTMTQGLIVDPLSSAEAPLREGRKSARAGRWEVRKGCALTFSLSLQPPRALYFLLPNLLYSRYTKEPFRRRYSLIHHCGFPFFLELIYFISSQTNYCKMPLNTFRVHTWHISSTVKIIMPKGNLINISRKRTNYLSHPAINCYCLLLGILKKKQ